MVITAIMFGRKHKEEKKGESYLVTCRVNWMVKNQGYITPH